MIVLITYLCTPNATLPKSTGICLISARSHSGLLNAKEWLMDDQEGRLQAWFRTQPVASSSSSSSPSSSILNVRMSTAEVQELARILHNPSGDARPDAETTCRYSSRAIDHGLAPLVRSISARTLSHSADRSGEGKRHWRYQALDTKSVKAYETAKAMGRNHSRKPFIASLKGIAPVCICTAPSSSRTPSFTMLS